MLMFQQGSGEQGVTYRAVNVEGLNPLFSGEERGRSLWDLYHRTGIFAAKHPETGMIAVMEIRDSGVSHFFSRPDLMSLANRDYESWAIHNAKWVACPLATIEIVQPDRSAPPRSTPVTTTTTQSVPVLRMRGVAPDDFDASRPTYTDTDIRRSPGVWFVFQWEAFPLAEAYMHTTVNGLSVGTRVEFRSDSGIVLEYERSAETTIPMTGVWNRADHAYLEVSP